MTSCRADDVMPSARVQVITFCDGDENDENTLHNFEAPSPQNGYCHGQSSWQVMRQHSDFADGKGRFVTHALMHTGANPKGGGTYPPPPFGALFFAKKFKIYKFDCPLTKIPAAPLRTQVVLEIELFEHV